MRGNHDRPWFVRSALDLRPDPGSSGREAQTGSTEDRATVRDRTRARAYGGGVRGGSPRCRDRVQKAPRLVREGGPRLGRAEAEAPRGGEPFRGGGRIRVVPREPASLRRRQCIDG